MTSPFTPYAAPERTFITATPGTPTPRARGRGGTAGAKRGRKPRGGGAATVIDTHTHTHAQAFAPPRPSPLSQDLTASASTSAHTASGALQWTQPATPSLPGPLAASGSGSATEIGTGPSVVGQASAAAAAGVVLPANAQVPVGHRAGAPGGAGADEDGEGEDELLPAMADDDYSTLANWQTQSKDNLKVLMENFTPEQYERFEAYRRHALPKQGVRKVIQQTLGQQVSQPVAQVVAGFAKVFVGEMVEKARAVQARRGDTGPLSPDHLREAYRMYQEETGRVGAARPLRSKRLFLR